MNIGSRLKWLILTLVIATGCVPETPAPPSVVQISAGSWHTCALKSDGSVYCWGRNYYGQLGDGTTADSAAPRRVVNLAGVKQISAGGGYTCALKTAGTVYCWGQNDSGELGNGTFVHATTPSIVPGLSNVTQIGAGSPTCALNSDGTVACWGYNYFGAVGNGVVTRTAPTGINSPVLVSGLTDVASLAVGTMHACAVRSNGSASCWGYNVTGQLGNGTFSDPYPYTINYSTPQSVVGPQSFSKLEAGGTFWAQTCSIRTDKTVSCWGNNENGQLGIGTTGATHQNTPQTVPGLVGVVDISAGARFACAARLDNTVVCWGSNSFGQLGDGSVTASASPKVVPSLTTVKEISAGYDHACALTSTHKVACWGSNSNGQLGLNGVPIATTPQEVTGL